MKDFFELIVKKFGFPEFLASYIMLFVYLLIFVYSLFKTYRQVNKHFINRFIKKVLDQDLHPFFTSQELVNYTKYYIPQYFQNITPSEGEELGSKHAAAARSKLMPEFLKKGLLSTSPIKYFIILSDTGMGKTAFLLNLYRKYKTLSPNRNKVIYNIRLFPLGARNALSEIRLLNDKGNTILLLDAFDEDIKAVADYKERMIEILEEVKQFRKVIFTCRTQFFPNKDEEPHDTDDITFGENIKHSIHKLYLSAFDEADVLKYLFKKYEFNVLKLYRAYQLVKKCPSLMFRPMLLTYIDDLLQGRLFYSYSFEMYQVMIDKWVRREAAKPAIRNRAASLYSTGIYSYEEKLWKFSYELAVNLYDERERHGGYVISVNEIKRILGKRTIGEDVLSIDDSTGRSLLNRNSIGQFKFAHKSILEYLLARKIFFDPKLLARFDFHGMDATKNFHNEMLTDLLKGFEGTYTTNNDPKPKPFHSIVPRQIIELNTLVIFKVGDYSAENFAGLNNVKQIIYANGSLLPLYIVYLYIELDHRNEKHMRNGSIVRENYGAMEPYDSVRRDIEQTLPKLNAEYVKSLLDNCTIDKNMKNRISSCLDLASRENRKESLRCLDELLASATTGRSEKAMILDAYESFRKFKKIKEYLPSVDMRF